MFLPGESKSLPVALDGVWNNKYVTGIQTEMKIYHSKANLDEKVLFGKITLL